MAAERRKAAQSWPPLTRGLSREQRDWGRERLPLSQKSKIFASSPDKGSQGCAPFFYRKQQFIILIQILDQLG